MVVWEGPRVAAPIDITRHAVRPRRARIQAALGQGTLPGSSRAGRLRVGWNPSARGSKRPSLERDALVYPSSAIAVRVAVLPCERLFSLRTPQAATRAASKQQQAEHTGREEGR